MVTKLLPYFLLFFLLVALYATETKGEGNSGSQEKAVKQNKGFPNEPKQETKERLSTDAADSIPLQEEQDTAEAETGCCRRKRTKEQKEKREKGNKKTKEEKRYLTKQERQETRERLAHDAQDLIYVQGGPAFEELASEACKKVKDTYNKIVKKKKSNAPLNRTTDTTNATMETGSNKINTKTTNSISETGSNEIKKETINSETGSNKISKEKTDSISETGSNEINKETTNSETGSNKINKETTSLTSESK